MYGNAQPHKPAAFLVITDPFAQHAELLMRKQRVHHPHCFSNLIVFRLHVQTYRPKRFTLLIQHGIILLDTYMPTCFASSAKHLHAGAAGTAIPSGLHSLGHLSHPVCDHRRYWVRLGPRLASFSSSSSSSLSAARLPSLIARSLLICGLNSRISCLNVTLLRPCGCARHCMLTLLTLWMSAPFACRGSWILSASCPLV
jgi:hypothetical protein